MLVLTRRLNEAVVIGKDVEIKVLEIDSSSIKLGIVAPKEISIYRKELYEQIVKENIQAAKRKEVN